MNRTAFVYLDRLEKPVLVGRLWARDRNGRQSSSFEYAESWLSDPQRFALDPAMIVGPGPFHTDKEKSLLGAIGDSAPDRWGRVLMRRAERQKAKTEGRSPRALMEIDFLLLVNDETRQGALRFAEKEEGPFLANDPKKSIPPLIELPRLLAASERVMQEEEGYEDLKLLLAPGSSLGGARPKASIRDQDGGLAIAKFPGKDDEYPVILWESVALKLAAKAGIETPVHRLENIGDKKVLILKRFDRIDKARIPFLSAMSMLNAQDNEVHSYLEFVEALRQHGSKPKTDISQLWRRIAFNILISNTDDHLRNHGFLGGATGWCLSPAYDLNPVPTDVKPRILTTEIQPGEAHASIDALLEVAAYFDLSLENAKKIAYDVAQVTSKWRDLATKEGLSKSEQDRLSSAFEHRDLEESLGF